MNSLKIWLTSQGINLMIALIVLIGVYIFKNNEFGDTDFNGYIFLAFVLISVIIGLPLILIYSIIEYVLQKNSDSNNESKVVAYFIIPFITYGYVLALFVLFDIINLNMIFNEKDIQLFILPSFISTCISSFYHFHKSQKNEQH